MNLKLPRETLRARLMARIRAWKDKQGKKSGGKPLIGKPAAMTGKRKLEKLNRELLDAAKEGKENEVGRLLKAGADKDAADHFGRTALMKAARNGHTGVAKLLVGEKVDVNAKDDNNVTALMNATIGGHMEIAELLVGKGANVNAKNTSGRTALDYAINSGKTAVAEFLESKGAKRGRDLP